MGTCVVLSICSLMSGNSRLVSPSIREFCVSAGHQTNMEKYFFLIKNRPPMINLELLRKAASKFCQRAKIRQCDRSKCDTNCERYTG